MTNIEELISWKDRNLHILTTSRRDDIIEDSIKLLNNDKERIYIQSTLVNVDIRAYIQNRLLTDRNLKRWRNKPEVQQEIEDTLMEKVDGM